MNLFGKILTVIILILSLVFSVVAVMVGVNYKNFKDEAAALKTKVQEEEALKVNLQATVQKIQQELQQEKVARARALAELQSRKITLEAQVQQKEEELLAEKQKATNALAQEKEALARTAELDARIDEQTKENKALAEAIARFNKEFASLQNQNYALQTDLNNKEERTKQLLAMLAKAEHILSVYKLDMESDTASIEPPVDAVITSVAKDLVVFSVGIDDGVREGHQFDVYRGNKYVGRVEVTKLYGGNRVAGKIMDKALEFRVNDTVMTRKEVSTIPTIKAGG